MKTAPIYIVDDEPGIAQSVQYALEAEGFVVRYHSTGSSCLQALADETPALILLDIGLADGSGFDFFRQIRVAGYSVPVIFMTARGDEIDRVVGLEMGAEDYIVKPFSLRELVARVRVVLRRSDNTSSIPKAPGGPGHDNSPHAFHIDSNRKQIRYHNSVLNLTLHEYRLLETLLSQPGRVFSREQLLNQAWDAPDHRLERTIDSHIKSLRNKLREIANNENPIVTHRGMGYSLESGL
ncbi:MAG: two-component system response regulator CreB [Pseudomonadales bacterium]|nr:two-component system response regulator CreB [Pseudomonadales bacterium]